MKKKKKKHNKKNNVNRYKYVTTEDNKQDDNADRVNTEDNNNGDSVNTEETDQGIIEDDVKDNEGLVCDEEGTELPIAKSGDGNIGSGLSTGRKLLIVLACLFVYGLLSCVVLVKDHYSDKEYATYNMGTNATYPSELLGKEAAYRQYFYTPRRTNGLDIQLGTYMTELRKSLYVSVYDAETDELIGTTKIPHKDISDNAFARAIFKDYRLDEGKHFYFEVYFKKDVTDTVSLWLGTNTSDYADKLTYNGEEVEDSGVSFRLIYEFNGRGLIIWIFISVIFALILNAVVVKLYGNKLIRYQVVAALVQMCMIIALLWGYSQFIMR